MMVIKKKTKINKVKKWIVLKRFGSSYLKKVDGGSVLKIDDFFVKARESDSYIDCLPLLNKFNKPFYSWYKRKRTAMFLAEFYITKKLNEKESIIKEIDPKYGKFIFIWVHPQIFIQMVQSIFPKYELLTTDWVLTIHKQGFIDIRNELIQEKNKHKKLVIKHKTILRKRNHYKLKKGYCVYLRTTDSSNLILKIGSTKDINKIMAEARRHFSKSLLVNCVYLNENHYKLFEKCMLVKWECFLISLNHEQLANIPLDKAILEMSTVLNLLKIPHSVASVGRLNEINQAV